MTPDLPFLPTWDGKYSLESVKKTQQVAEVGGPGCPAALQFNTTRT
jgi:hypothetical protein